MRRFEDGGWEAIRVLFTLKRGDKQEGPNKVNTCQCKVAAAGSLCSSIQPWPPDHATMSSSAPSFETPPTPSSLHVPSAFLQTTPTIRTLILPAFLDLSNTTDTVVRDLARQADSFTRATNEEAVVDLFKPVLRTAFYHQNISGLPQVTVEKIDFSSMNVCGARDWRQSFVHQAILRYMDSMRPSAPASDASVDSRATGSNNSQSSSNCGARKPDFMLVLSSASKIQVHSELKSNPGT